MPPEQHIDEKFFLDSAAQANKSIDSDKQLQEALDYEAAEARDYDEAAKRLESDKARAREAAQCATDLVQMIEDYNFLESMEIQTIDAGSVKRAIYGEFEVFSNHPVKNKVDALQIAAQFTTTCSSEIKKRTKLHNAKTLKSSLK